MRKRSLFRFAAAAVLSAGLIMAQGPAQGQAPAGQGQRFQQRFQKIATLLNLTSDQQTQIESILQQSFTSAQPLMQEMRTNRQAIEQLVKSGTAGADFDKQIQPLASTQANVVSQLTVLHAKAFAQVWNLLTPDQRTKAEDLRGLMPGFGMGGGPRGMGMGMHRGGPAH